MTKREWKGRECEEAEGGGEERVAQGAEKRLGDKYTFQFAFVMRTRNCCQCNDDVDT